MPNFIAYRTSSSPQHWAIIIMAGQRLIRSRSRTPEEEAPLTPTKRVSDGESEGRSKSPRSVWESPAGSLQMRGPQLTDVGGQCDHASSPLEEIEQMQGGGGSGVPRRGTLESAKANPTDQAPGRGVGPTTVAQPHIRDNVPDNLRNSSQDHPGRDYPCDHGRLWTACGRAGKWRAAVECIGNRITGDPDYTINGTWFCAQHCFYWFSATAVLKWR